MGNMHRMIERLKPDLLASLVVALIAMPLSLGIAIASGAPTVMAGIIAAAVGGIVAGLVGGAPFQVTGPAAGLTLVVFGLIHQLGWGVMCAATVLAGFFQVALGSARIGKVCLAISPSVVHGMLAAVGIVITLSQMHLVLGGSPQSSAWLNLKEMPEQVLNLHGTATMLGLLTISTMVLWKYLPAKVRVIPGPLVAILMATMISQIFSLDVARVHLPGNLLNSIELPTLPNMDRLGSFLFAALTIALVASTESLLSAVATDKLHSGRPANLNRELVGQGFANIASGMCGGLPVTGVIVRSSTNIRAGARSNLSAILHGVWIILAVLLFLPSIQLIPLSALAGLLVYVGVQLVNVDHIRAVSHHREGFVYFVTLMAVVFWDLMGGVILGIALSAIMLFWRISQTRVIVQRDDSRWQIQVTGAATFLSVPELMNALSTVPAGKHVDVDLATEFVDHAVIEALHSWRLSHEKTGGNVDIDASHEQRIEGQGWSRVNLETFDDPPSMNRAVTRLLNGVARFNRSSSKTAPLLARLASRGQTPKVLFIGCSDSRIVPPLFTNTRPGDLFELRNVGNLAPAAVDISVGASVDFALGVLGVELIVVCGHSDCGAMKALLAAERPKSPSLAQWLEYGNHIVDSFKDESYGELVALAPGTKTEHDKLAQFNAMQQLNNLRQHPLVKEREDAGQLRLFALYFDIGNARTFCYDPDTNSYIAGDTFFSMLKEQNSKALIASKDKLESRDFRDGPLQ